MQLSKKSKKSLNELLDCSVDLLKQFVEKIEDARVIESSGYRIGPAIWSDLSQISEQAGELIVRIKANA
jgi:hypothetical protein